MAILVTTLPSGVRSNDVRAAATAAVCLFPQSPPQLRTATNHTHTHIRVQTNTHTHSEKQRQKTRSMRWRLRVIIEEEQWLTQREEQHSLVEATTQHNNAKSNAKCMNCKFAIDDYYKICGNMQVYNNAKILGNNFE